MLCTYCPPLLSLLLLARKWCPNVGSAIDWTCETDEVTIVTRKKIRNRCSAVPCLVLRPLYISPQQSARPDCLRKGIPSHWDALSVSLLSLTFGISRRQASGNGAHRDPWLENGQMEVRPFTTCTAGHRTDPHTYLSVYYSRYTSRYIQGRGDSSLSRNSHL